jgi:hypothetical protein
MMVAIVSVETILLVLLLVLVAGLLRSNAEILRRLGPPGEDVVTTPAQGARAAGEPAQAARAAGPGAQGARAAGPGAQGARAAGPPATPARFPGPPAAPLSGPTPAGDAIRLDFAAAGTAPTLLAFLTTGCGTCAGFWETLDEPRLPDGVRTVVVTHGAERERPARLRQVAPAGVPVVMSSQAWRDYDVPGAPYFVLVDQTIRGEGAATSWTALTSLVTDAIEDARAAGDASRESAPDASARLAVVPSGGTGRALRVDRTLQDAGIGPDHPSLYPGQPAPQP